MNTKINYLLLIIGGIIALYANSGEQQNEYFLIVGIVLFVIGIYRIARTIPSKTDVEDYGDDNVNRD